ncbi:MAG TPA: parallel beta-helix domain-containing protein [Candidatus Limnocylindrales bacterium]|nr:parallel beta-helix domain-containing protein [Candidatus Limnocylindrales bacterium]
MKNFLAGTAAAAAALAFATGAMATTVGPPYIEAHTAPIITAPAPGAAECQTAIAKNSQKYIKSLTKIRTKCLAASVEDGAINACPNADDDEKAQKAAIKASEKIAEACATSTGLGNSYSGASGANIASCTLGQNHATTEIYIAETNGENAGPSAVDCQVSIDKAAGKLLANLVKNSDKCIEDHLKAGDSTDLGTKCVGSSTTLVITRPTDEKTDGQFNKNILKAWDSIVSTCETLSADEISGLFGCPGATTFDNLHECVEATAINALHEVVNQQYSETGEIITGTIQAAVTAASSGDKLLVPGGVNYAEGVVIPGGTCSVSLGSCPGDKKCSAVSQHPGTACAEDEDCYGTCDVASDNPGADCTVNADCPNGACQVGTCVDSCTGGGGDVCQSPADNVSIVGCGAATDDRPRVIPPAVAPPNRGFLAAGVDGLHFEGLEVTGWANDGIFVSGANGVSFRDIYGDGDNLSTANVDAVSTYAIFPVQSTNVVVEGSEVVNVRDAGIYVGQSQGVIMRHNLVHDCVSGMELENSKDGIVYGNVTHDNTGGLLVFKLPGPEHQVSGGHNVFDNLIYENNVRNFAIPGTTVSAVPTGTGMMVISEDDSVFANNYVTLNDSYGILIIDQVTINALAGNQFDPPSYDQDTSNLQFLNNLTPGGANKKNGSHPWGNCAGGADDGDVCDTDSECDTNTCTDTPFSGNWTYAISTGANGTCWDPYPTAPASVLGPPDFPVCP